MARRVENANRRGRTDAAVQIRAAGAAHSCIFLIEPVTDYIDQALEEDPDQMITVIVPQAVPKHWWQGLLHNNAAVALKLALASRKNVVITNVRYFLK